MSDVKVPDFIKNYNPNAEMPVLAQWIDKYDDMFDDRSTEDKIMTDEEWIKALKYCVENKVRIDDYLQLGSIDPDDEI